MTLPLRRKRRTTVPSITGGATRTNAVDRLLRVAAARSRKLSYLLIATCSLSTLLPTASAADSSSQRTQGSSAGWSAKAKVPATSQQRQVRRATAKSPNVSVSGRPTLQWRAPSVPGSSSESSTSDEASVAVHVAKIGGQPQTGAQAVRQTVLLSPANPFQDPFGDARGTQDPSAAGSDNPSAVDTAPQPMPMPETMEPTPMELSPQETPMREQPSPMPPTVKQPRDELPPPPASAPESRPAPFQPPIAPQTVPPPYPGPNGTNGTNAQECDRIYNNRNCCREGEQCSAMLKALDERRISDISLDITADFKEDIHQETELAKAPSRIWENNEGEVIAEGRLTDLAFGRVVITTDDGRTVEYPHRKLSNDDRCFVAAWWFLPLECALGEDQFVARAWLPQQLHWKASALCHKPLYFEEVQLERYGHTMGPVLQPVVSGAHFFVNIAVLPYKMGIHPLHECQYALGYYRPGSCAPWLVPPVPISLRGALSQAGVMAGGAAIIP